jgi:hypothetical protein
MFDRGLEKVWNFLGKACTNPAHNPSRPRECSYLMNVCRLGTMAELGEAKSSKKLPIRVTLPPPSASLIHAYGSKKKAEPHVCASGRLIVFILCLSTITFSLHTTGQHHEHSWDGYGRYTKVLISLKKKISLHVHDVDDFVH